MHLTGFLCWYEASGLFSVTAVSSLNSLQFSDTVVWATERAVKTSFSYSRKRRQSFLKRIFTHWMPFLLPYHANYPLA